MNSNVGPEDRIVRIVVAIAIAIVIYVDVIDGVAAYVAGAIAAYLLLTGLFSRCLVYKAAGIDTSVHEQPYTTTDDRSGL